MLRGIKNLCIVSIALTSFHAAPLLAEPISQANSLNKQQMSEELKKGKRSSVVLEYNELDITETKDVEIKTNSYLERNPRFRNELNNIEETRDIQEETTAEPINKKYPEKYTRKLFPEKPRDRPKYVPKSFMDDLSDLIAQYGLWVSIGIMILGVAASGIVIFKRREIMDKKAEEWMNPSPDKLRMIREMEKEFTEIDQKIGHNMKEMRDTDDLKKICELYRDSEILLSKFSLKWAEIRSSMSIIYTDGFSKMSWHISDSLTEIVEEKLKKRLDEIQLSFSEYERVKHELFEVYHQYHPKIKNKKMFEEWKKESEEYIQKIRNDEPQLYSIVGEFLLAKHEIYNFTIQFKLDQRKCKKICE